MLTCSFGGYSRGRNCRVSEENGEDLTSTMYTPVLQQEPGKNRSRDRRTCSRFWCGHRRRLEVHVRWKLSREKRDRASAVTTHGEGWRKEQWNMCMRCWRSMFATDRQAFRSQAGRQGQAEVGRGVAVKQTSFAGSFFAQNREKCEPAPSQLLLQMQHVFVSALFAERPPALVLLLLLL